MARLRYTVPMSELRFLAGYPAHVLDQVRPLLVDDRLGEYLRQKYPQPHELASAKALYDFTMDLKNRYLRKSRPISKVVYDDRIQAFEHALGQHAFVSRVQGSKLKAANEIRIASVFKRAPLALLRVVVVHELAHLKEKEHNKAFYRLCEHMEPDYHQLEFDMRLFLTHVERHGALY